jgi:hypothetical protein
MWRTKRSTLTRRASFGSWREKNCRSRSFSCCCKSICASERNSRAPDRYTKSIPGNLDLSDAGRFLGTCSVLVFDTTRLAKANELIAASPPPSKRLAGASRMAASAHLFHSELRLIRWNPANPSEAQKWLAASSGFRKIIDRPPLFRVTDSQVTHAYGSHIQ